MAIARAEFLIEFISIIFNNRDNYLSSFKPQISLFNLQAIGVNSTAVSVPDNLAVLPIESRL